MSLTNDMAIVRSTRRIMRTKTGGNRESKRSRSNKSKKAISPVIATVIIVAVTIAVAISAAFWLGGLSSLFTRFERIEFYTGFPDGSAPTYNITLLGQSSGTSDSSIRELVVRDRPISAFENGDFRVAFWVTEPGTSAPTLHYLCGVGPCVYSGGYNGTVVTSVYSSPLNVPIPSGSQIKASILFSSIAPLVAGQSIQISISTSAGQEFGRSIALP